MNPQKSYAQAKYNQATIYANVAVKYYGRQTGWDGLGIDNGGDYLSAASAKQLYAQMSKYGDKVIGSLGADIIYANSGDDHIYGSQFINPKTDNRSTDEKNK